MRKVVLLALFVLLMRIEYSSGHPGHVQVNPDHWEISLGVGTKINYRWSLIAGSVATLNYPVNGTMTEISHLITKGDMISDKIVSIDNEKIFFTRTFSGEAYSVTTDPLLIPRDGIDLFGKFARPLITTNESLIYDFYQELDSTNVTIFDTTVEIDLRFDDPTIDLVGKLIYHKNYGFLISQHLSIFGTEDDIVAEFKTHFVNIESTVNNNNNNGTNYSLFFPLVSFVIMISTSILLHQIRKESIELIGKEKQLVKEIFKSQTSLYFVLLGQNEIENERVKNEINKAIPKNLSDFKYLLHPTRLSISKLLFENLEMTSIELKNILEISWNDYSYYIRNLESKGYVHLGFQFINGGKTQTVSLSSFGINQYKMLIDLLHIFLDDTSQYTEYLTDTPELKTNADEDLYPID